MFNYFLILSFPISTFTYIFISWIEFRFYSKQNTKNTKNSIVNKKSYQWYLLNVLLSVWSPERARVHVVVSYVSPVVWRTVSLSEEIPAQARIHLEGLGRSVLSVGVAMMLAWLTGGSRIDVLIVVAEVHGSGFYF